MDSIQLNRYMVDERMNGQVNGWVGEIGGKTNVECPTPF